MRMKERETILGGCCTRCMQYSGYALLSVNSRSCRAEIERDDLTLCYAMMVQLWTRKREMDSVSNGFNPLEQFQVRVATGPNCYNGL